MTYTPDAMDPGGIRQRTTPLSQLRNATQAVRIIGLPANARLSEQSKRPMAAAFLGRVRLKNERGAAPEDRPAEARCVPGLARGPLARERSWVGEESWDGGPAAGRSIEGLGEVEIRCTVEEARFVAGG